MSLKNIFRLTLLLLIYKYKPHGYELMKKIEEISNGLIKVGPGTIYPALFLLKKRGLITEIVENDRRKRYELTEKGLKELLSHISDLEFFYKNVLSIISELKQNISI